LSNGRFCFRFRVVVLIKLGVEFFFCPQIFWCSQFINVENAVEMIDFMLEDASRPAA
jgi:hypothetical protein